MFRYLNVLYIKLYLKMRNVMNIFHIDINRIETRNCFIQNVSLKTEFVIAELSL